MARPIEQWMQILGDLPSPEGENSEVIMANRIFGDLTGYRDNSSHKSEDAKQLANAMIAYGRMMFDAGVRP